MPVIAIGAAVVAGVEAAGAIGAVVAGGALTLTGALEITAAVGATLGAVGVVTHDKGLSMAGLVLGGIGGVGALASSAGLFGADAGTASLFGGAEDAAAAGGFPASVSITPEIAGSNPGGYLGAAITATGSSGIVDSLGGVDASKVLPTAAINEQTGLAGGAAADPAEAFGGVTHSATSATNPATTSTSSLSPASTGGLPKPIPLTTNPALTPPAPATPTMLSQSIAQAGGNAPLSPVSVEPPGFLSGIGDFMTKHDYATYGLIQASGSLVSGLFNPVTPAQVEALNAQAAQNRAAASVTSQQATNMAGPIPVASRTPPVTGSTGLINSRPPTSAVTGAPA